MDSDKDTFLGAYSWRTTFHGLHYVLGPYSTCRRVVWAIVFLLAAALAAYNMVATYMYYLSYPKNTESYPIMKENIQFPSVTLCNLNSLSLTALSEAALYRPFIDSVHSRPVVESDQTKLGSPIEFYNNMSQSQDNFIISCRWDGKPCEAGALSPVLTDRGRCYTFTGDNKVRRTSSGLHLRLNTAIYDTVAAVAEDDGVQVLLHSTTDSGILMRRHGTPVSPGFHTHIDFTTVQSSLLAAPYGACDVIGEGCMTKCLEQNAKKMCGCSPYYTHSSGSGNICGFAESPETLQCVKKITELGDCQCPVPCESTDYRSTLSQSRLSEAKLTRELTNDTREMLMGQYMEARQAANIEGAPGLAPFNLRDNLVELTLLTRNEVTKVTQTPVYTWSTLMRDIGLMLVIMLGVSVLSFVELIDLLITGCYHCAHGDSSKHV